MEVVEVLEIVEAGYSNFGLRGEMGRLLHRYYSGLFFFLFAIIGFWQFKEASTAAAAAVVADDENGKNTTMTTKKTLNVGVILDMDTWVGMTGMSCISMAVDDFYGAYGDKYNTRLALHFRDSKNDVVAAADAALDLIKNAQVKAIIGPQKSAAAKFVVDMGERAHVPIISFSATSPSLSPTQTPYFVRTVPSDSAHVQAIAAIIQAFKWRRVVLIYEETDYGQGVVPYLTDALEDNGTPVPYRTIIPLSATDVEILEQLYKLKTMQTRVFIVHISSRLASRFFPLVDKAEMMSEGYVWFITDGLTDLLESLDPSVINSMQGVLGVKTYVERTNKLDDFMVRWRKEFRREHPDIERFQLSDFGLWAYDTIWAIAMASEKVGNFSSQFQAPKLDRNPTDLASAGVSQEGPSLLNAIREIKFQGLSGKFQLLDGQLQSSAFQIVNVVGKGERSIGFWTPENGLMRTLNMEPSKESSVSAKLRAIIWPGESASVPKGWVVPTSSKKLRIGVPVKKGFKEFVKVERDAETNETIVTGFCIDVFKAVVDSLPYALTYEFIPFEREDGNMAGNYDALVHQVYLQKYDAVVGDITVTTNRSLNVEFTLPFTESGISLVAPYADNSKTKLWTFLKPLSLGLSLMTLAAFICIGIVVWALEHEINSDFRGTKSEQISTVLWFTFSTLVFAHKEKVISNLARFVMIIWLFVVLILTQSYTACLTSLLTVRRLEPAVTTLKDLLKTGEAVGYQQTSFLYGWLKNQNFKDSNLKPYNTAKEYDAALSKGSRNGGVAAIIQEIPYSKFMSKYCDKYHMVSIVKKTGGFGFVFPKGSPLVADFSRAILNVTEGDRMVTIEQAWFGSQKNCLSEGTTLTVTSNSFSLESFGGLFIITGVATFSALIIFLYQFVYRNGDVFAMADVPIWKRIGELAKRFDNGCNSHQDCEEPKENGAQENRGDGAQAGARPSTISNDVSPRPSNASINTDATLITEGESSNQVGSPPRLSGFSSSEETSVEETYN